MRLQTLNKMYSYLLDEIFLGFGLFVYGIFLGATLAKDTQYCFENQVKRELEKVFREREKEIE